MQPEIFVNLPALIRSGVVFRASDYVEYGGHFVACHGFYLLNWGSGNCNSFRRVVLGFQGDSFRDFGRQWRGGRSAVDQSPAGSEVAGLAGLVVADGHEVGAEGYDWHGAGSPTGKSKIAASSSRVGLRPRITWRA